MECILATWLKLQKVKFGIVSDPMPQEKCSRRELCNWECDLQIIKENANELIQLKPISL